MENEKGRVHKRKNPFAQIDRRIINDPRLSWKATGLMTYFLDKPNGWEFNLSHIIKSKTDGEKAVRSGINELKEAGYIVRVAFRKNGRIDDYEFFVYDEPVKYPTTKDLHIDRDLWEKYKEIHKDEEPIDITVAALEIKKWKEEMKKQVSQNGKPEKDQGFEQVSQNGKPEENQGSEQVSGFQHPEKQDPEKEGQSISNLPITNNINNHDDDPRYLQLRIMFITNGGEDIKRHDLHYPKFQEALSAIGSFDRMKELAEKYIKAVKEGKHHHKKPQIVWFLSESWQNFITPTVRKMTRKADEKPFPKAVAMQLAQEQQDQQLTGSKISDEEAKERHRRALERLAQFEEEMKQQQQQEALGYAMS